MGISGTMLLWFESYLSDWFMQGVLEGWGFTWRFSTAWYGMVRFSTVHFWGVFHWVQYLVLFLVPPWPRFKAIRTVTKTWWVNSAVHWLAGENRHYCITELQHKTQYRPARFKSAQPAKDRTQLLFEQTHILDQPKNSCFVVCWGSTDIPLVDSRGADPASAWRGDAEWKIHMYISYFLHFVYFFSMFSVYIFNICICVLLQLKTIWSIKCTSRLY